MAQGTIKHYEAGEGSLLMEDGTEVVIDGSSISDDAIRTLRIGQRVKFDLQEGSGRKVARALRLVTFE